MKNCILGQNNDMLGHIYWKTWQIIYNMLVQRRKMFFMKNKENLILKLARKCGENSIGRCFGWFNQPKVPAKLKEKK